MNKNLVNLYKKDLNVKAKRLLIFFTTFLELLLKTSDIKSYVKSDGLWYIEAFIFIQYLRETLDYTMPLIGS